MEEVMDTVALLPDSKAENELSIALRRASAEDASAVIFSILSAPDSAVRLAGLRVAKRVLRDGMEADKIVLTGLERGDAYEIRFWLQSASAIVGARKTLTFVANAANVMPDKVVKSWREISAFAGDDRSGRLAIARIAKIIDETRSRLDDTVQKYWSEVKPEAILPDA